MVAAVLEPHVRDLGAFTVRRVLPGHRHKMVGPFIFFDHIGPATLPAGRGVDVRPHPHIGLATVTYLFEGAILHRDSLGSLQRIEPGDVNWMTAGRGIVHSERSSAADLANEQRLHGIQTWVALPRAAEDVAPSFVHHAKAELPAWTEGGAAMRLIVGTYGGRQAPTMHYSPIFYVAVLAPAGSRFIVPPEHAERAVYLVEGEASVDGAALPPAHMAVLEPDHACEVVVARDAKLMLAGGATMDGDRFIWWNFVASSKERLEAGKAAWRDFAADGVARGNSTFGLVPGDERDFIPLPEK